MIGLTLLLLIGLIFVFLRRRDWPRAATPAMALLAAAALATASIQLFGRAGNRATRRRLVSISEAIGVRIGGVLAEEIPAGAKTLVLHNGASAYLAPARDELEGFLTGLRRATADRKIEVLPYSPPLAPEEEIILAADYLPMEILRHALRDHPDARAYVSLMGAPLPDLRSLPNGLPPIYAAMVSTPETARPLLRQGIVRAIVFSRADARTADKRPIRMTSEELFDARFTMERTPK